jgi:hypothetical protein
MSKRHFALLVAASFALDGIWATSNATPFTFEFNLPDWEVNGNPALFGSNAQLDVTVDNGAPNELSQTYLLSQIELIGLTAVGGTYSDTWVPSNVTVHQFLGDSYLSTDSAGIPTLNLLESSKGCCRRP